MQTGPILSINEQIIQSHMNEKITKDLELARRAIVRASNKRYEQQVLNKQVQDPIQDIHTAISILEDVRDEMIVSSRKNTTNNWTPALKQLIEVTVARTGNDTVESMNQITTKLNNLTTGIETP